MIRIMVDSASDLREEDGLFDYHVPIRVNVAGKEYLGGRNLTSDEFYPLMMESREQVSTSQPSPEEFIRPFEEVKARGEELIYFALSSALSGTWQGACIARDMVDWPGIHIVDTAGATHMVRYLVQHAGQRIKQGASGAEIVAECEALKGRIRLAAGLDTLEYLRRGGRLSGASALVGTLAKVKPEIEISRKGTVAAVGKHLGVGKAIAGLVSRVEGYEPDPEFPLYTLYTWGTENCEKLENKLAERGISVAGRLQVGPVIGAHIGPEAYGFICVVKE